MEEDPKVLTPGGTVRTYAVSHRKAAVPDPGKYRSPFKKHEKDELVAARKKKQPKRR
jgi:hypothetical protein